MELYKDVDVLQNKRILIIMNVLSIIMLPICYFIFAYMAPLLTDAKSDHFPILNTLIAIFILLMIHELIHGTFFKLFNPEGKVKYGFKAGLVYASSPLSKYTPMQFIIIGLSPFIIITVALIVLLMTNVISPGLFISVATMHTAGCAGDFYMMYEIFRAPKDILVEDTENGMKFYKTA